jgi:hypothetical protein
MESPRLHAIHTNGGKRQATPHPFMFPSLTSPLTVDTSWEPAESDDKWGANEELYWIEIEERQRLERIARREERKRKEVEANGTLSSHTLSDGSTFEIFECEAPYLSYDVHDRIGESQRNFKRRELAINSNLPPTEEVTRKRFMNLHQQLCEEVAAAEELAIVKCVKDHVWAEIIGYSKRNYEEFGDIEVDTVRPRIEDLVVQLIKLRRDVQFYCCRKKDWEADAKQEAFISLHSQLCKEMETIKKNGIEECLVDQSVIDIMEYIERDGGSFDQQEIDIVQPWFENTVAFMTDMNDRAELYSDWKIDAKPAEKRELLVRLHQRLVKEAAELVQAGLQEQVKTKIWSNAVLYINRRSFHLLDIDIMIHEIRDLVVELIKARRLQGVGDANDKVEKEEAEMKLESQD